MKSEEKRKRGEEKARKKKRKREEQVEDVDVDVDVDVDESDNGNGNGNGNGNDKGNDDGGNEKEGAVLVRVRVKQYPCAYEYDNKEKKEKKQKKKKMKKEKKRKKERRDSSKQEGDEPENYCDYDHDRDEVQKNHNEECANDNLLNDDDNDNDTNTDNDKHQVKAKALTKSQKRQKMEEQQDAETKAIMTASASTNTSTNTNTKTNNTSANASATSRSTPKTNMDTSTSTSTTNARSSRIVASSAIQFYDQQVLQKAENEEKSQKKFHLTLLLFYTYVEPIWDEPTYTFMLKTLQNVGKRLELTGRMRVAREGVNCTLTGKHESIVEYCKTLRKLRPKEFQNTEFKLTTDLPLAQKFPNLKVFKVVELVHYGLEGPKAPPIQKFQGTHLEPKDYHKKLGESDTVVIDVRNHYEAAIGRFVPPQEGVGVEPGKPPPKWLDPLMRKSTEFPVWLDKPETKEEMKGKQVLMYCTGGIRCERASALLKYKMETDPEIKALGIQGVYQLQGGIDKYFKEFPEGGYWKGKNYVFDKRFAHAPPKVDGALHGKEKTEEPEVKTIMGQCEACQKPWDMYRGKRRCPTCGVPSLICRDCFLADKEGRKKLGKEVRCDLCVEQGIMSKKEIRQKDEQDIKEYERKMARKGLLKPDKVALAPNPNKVTRLALKNMCRKNMDEATLMETVPGITHIVWKIERQSGKFLGQAWVEMATPDDAARAVARDGKVSPFGRPLYVSYQPPDGKDSWPPPNSVIGMGKT